MSTLFQRFSKNQHNQQNQQYQQNQPHKIYHLKIKSKHNSTKIFENFKIFQKNITIQKFLKINVPRFLEIHGP
jgi:hypothetical protein